MGVELIIIAVLLVGFIGWALLSGRFTRGRKDDVTKEPVTLHTEPGYRPDQDGPLRDNAAATTTRTGPTDSNANNMP